MRQVPSKRVILIVPAVNKPEAILATRVLGESGDVFTAKYRSGTSTETTHYGCNWPLTPNELEALKTAFEDRGILDQIDVNELDDPDPMVGRPTISEIKTRLNLRT
jgi:hypothetical protein